MLIVTLEGGLVSSVSSDDPALIEQLNRDGVAVLDYDTDGADDDELLSVKLKTQPGRPGEVNEAVGHVETVGETDIDTAWLARALGLEHWLCRLCGDSVRPGDFRQHLCLHNPHAQGMDIEDIIVQFKRGGIA